ncbi:hypothetical protein ACLMJK_007200 [Lecanora helva]
MEIFEDQNTKTYVVEHLDPELGQWSTLEYKAIAEESSKDGAKFCLSSVPKSLDVPLELWESRNLHVENRSIEDIVQTDTAARQRVCLLDPAAKTELTPEDGDVFTVFLFGGILGDDPPRGKESRNHAIAKKS